MAAADPSPALDPSHRCRRAVHMHNGLISRTGQNQGSNTGIRMVTVRASTVLTVLGSP